MGDSDEQHSSDSDIEQEYWDTDTTDVWESFNFNTSQDSQTSDDSSRNLPRIVKTTLLFLQLWDMFYNVFATALNHLIQFLHYLLISIAEKLPPLSDLASVFPTSLYKLRKCLSLNEDDFEKYVVCKKCNSVYAFKDCIVKASSGDKTKACKYTPYRNHPILPKRSPCGQNLLMEVTLLSKKEIKLIPYKTYCYHPLYKSLRQVLQRNSYLELCEKWRSRIVPERMLSDVYDGCI